MLDRRHILVVVLQGVVGVRVGGDDPADAGGANGLGVVVAQGHEQHLFAEPPYIVSAVPFLGAQDAEVLAEPPRMRAVARPIDWIRSS